MKTLKRGVEALTLSVIATISIFGTIIAIAEVAACL